MIHQGGQVAFDTPSHMALMENAAGVYPAARMKHQRCCCSANLIGLYRDRFRSFCASAFLGSVTVSNPFLKSAWILSASTLSGNPKLRSNEP